MKYFIVMSFLCSLPTFAFDYCTSNVNSSKYQLAFAANAKHAILNTEFCSYMATGYIRCHDSDSTYFIKDEEHLRSGSTYFLEKEDGNGPDELKIEIKKIYTRCAPRTFPCEDKKEIIVLKDNVELFNCSIILQSHF